MNIPFQSHFHVKKERILQIVIVEFIPPQFKMTRQASRAILEYLAPM